MCENGGMKDLAGPIVVGSLLLCLGCSSTKSAGYVGAGPQKGPDKGAGVGGGADGGAGPVGVFGGDAGSSPVVGECVPDPSNFEVPSNGCDDDGDGKVDNVTDCDSALAVDGDAAAFVKAIGLCQTTGANDKSWGVITATYTSSHSGVMAPNDAQHGILSKFGASVKPRQGASLGVLSTGYAREYDGLTGTDAFKGQKTAMGNIFGGLQGGPPMGYPKASTDCPALLSVTFDMINVKLEIRVPANAQGLQFDFDFYSGEWPEFVCSPYNDSFIAYLTAKGYNNGVPENVSLDAKNNPVSVNNGFFDRCTPGIQTGCQAGGATSVATCPGGIGELAATGFENPGPWCAPKTSSGGGATGWLTSTAPVTPGETITLEFMIWDTGDWNFDSSVLLDHFQWVPTPVQAGTQRPPN